MTGANASASKGSNRTGRMKSTMVKTVVGKVKTSTYDLPKSDHVYGATVIKDEYAAGDVISKWQVSKPSEAKKSDRDLIRTNVMAIEAGNLTAKDMRIFQQAHPDVRVKQSVSKLKREEDGRRTVTLPPGAGGKDRIYGVVTKKTEPPLSHLIEARYTDMTRDEMDYPDVMVLRKKNRMPEPRPTRASEGHSLRARLSAMGLEEHGYGYGPPEKERFVISRFRNIPSKYGIGVFDTKPTAAGAVSPTAAARGGEEAPESHEEPSCRAEAVPAC